MAFYGGCHEKMANWQTDSTKNVKAHKIDAHMPVFDEVSIYKSIFVIVDRINKNGKEWDFLPDLNILQLFTMTTELFQFTVDKASPTACENSKSLNYITHLATKAGVYHSPVYRECCNEVD